MLNEDIKKRFFKDTDSTGRFVVKSIVTGISYYVEPIGNDHSEGWGDLDPATKKMSGEYGDKYPGVVNEKDSLITEENGFSNISVLECGSSPMSEIERRDKEYELQMKKK